MKAQRPVSFLCAVVLLLSTLGAYAQQPAPAQAKRALTHNDYDSWRTVQSPQISRDGKFVAYAYMPQDGDGEIIVRNVATGADWRASRGYRPPVPPPDDPGANVAEIQAEQARLLRPVFTADTRFVVFGTEPSKAELNKAKKEKKKPEDMPKNGLGIMDLSTGEVTRIERVKSFRVPEDNGGFIAYLLEAASPAPQGEKPAAPAESQTQPQPPPRRNAKKKEYGTELVLRNTSTGT